MKKVALVLAAAFGLAGTLPTLSAPIRSEAPRDFVKSEALTKQVRWQTAWRTVCREKRHVSASSARRCHGLKRERYLKWVPGPGL
jgi:hypothetical protein